MVIQNTPSVPIIAQPKGRKKLVLKDEINLLKWSRNDPAAEEMIEEMIYDIVFNAGLSGFYKSRREAATEYAANEIRKGISCERMYTLLLGFLSGYLWLHSEQWRESIRLCGIKIR